MKPNNIQAIAAIDDKQLEAIQGGFAFIIGKLAGTHVMGKALEDVGFSYKEIKANR